MTRTTLAPRTILRLPITPLILWAIICTSVVRGQEFIEFEGHFYARTSGSKTWPEAEAEAVALGGHLVAVNSQEENDFVRDNFSQMVGPVWIGLSDSDTEGQFVWSNGDPLVYDNFAVDEPNDFPPGEDFVQIEPDGTWNDIFNDTVSLGVIELIELPTIPAQERAVLIALYQGSDGDNWINNSGWKAEPLAEDGFNDNPCFEPRWFGVTCGSGALEAIDLRFNGLQGIIPSQLGDLSQLETLNLFANDLSGALPPELGNLTKLRSLALGGGEPLLSGAIPSELGSLAELRDLLIIGTSITGDIPPALGNLSRIESFDLSQNQLTGEIPPELGNLGTLQRLNLFRNQLTGEIPSELGNLENLQTIRFLQNELEGPIPPEVGNLNNLAVLDLSRNVLTGSIPQELGNLSELSFLDLNSNRLTGEIPAEVFDLSNLRFLRLADNQLEGRISDEIGDLSDLLWLDLDRNFFSGVIPEQLANLTSLERLSLYANRLTGTIPVELEDLSNLEILFLCQNRLTGPIPPGLGTLSNLTSLWLGDNRLAGPIPPELGDLSALQFLSLSDAQLSGTIPPSIGSLSGLTLLDLSRNQLTGSLPPELAQLEGVSLLDLSSNQLEGEVPAEIAALDDDSVDIRDNHLTSVEGGLFDRLDQAQIGAARWDSLQSVAAVYPQLAIGGGFEVVLLLNNTSARAWTGTGFLDGARWPADRTWEMDGADMTGENSFEIDLSARETRKITLSSTSDTPFSGWLALRATGDALPDDLSVSFFYNLSGETGLSDSTGVGRADFSTFFRFPVEQSETVLTGVAIRSVAGNGAALSLVGSDGELLETSQVDSDDVGLVNELFEGVPGEFIGSMVISSNVPFYVTVIRVEITESDGVQLTSVPPLAR